MNDVPLIRKTDVNDINTSLIAIKKQLKQLNEAVGLIDVPDVDLTPFVRKDEVVNVIEAGNMNPVTSNAVVPTNEVTSGNMNPVTSNAVATALSYSTEEVDTGAIWTDGNKIYKKTYISTSQTLRPNTNITVVQKSGIDTLKIALFDIVATFILNGNKCCIGYDYLNPFISADNIIVSQTFSSATLNDVTVKVIIYYEK